MPSQHGESVNVLVTAASRHGSTTDIADLIAETLNGQGLNADAKPINLVSRIEPYDAVVLGSAIYFGRWLDAAVEFATIFASELNERPVWLFSSGPVGASGRAAADPDVSPLTGRIHPRGHQIFAGALDKGQLTLLERTVVRLVRAKFGDFRDWEQIRAWSMGIADELRHLDSAAGKDDKQ